MSPHTKSFMTGTSNGIFLHHKACNIDAIVHADSGELEIINPTLNSLLTLTAADKKFIDNIVQQVVSKYTPDEDMSQAHQIEFQGYEVFIK